jgi:transposase
MPSTTAKPSNLPPRYSLPELALPAVLPTDAAALTALLHSVIAAHNDVKAQALNHMQHMMEQFILARHRMFGASSEQSSGQGRLFDEAEALAAGGDAPQDVAPLPPDTKCDGKTRNKPARGKRGPLPTELQRVDVVHDVPAAERTCPCGTPMVEIGEDVSEQLDLVPMQVRVLRHIRKRYGCPGSAHAPVTAALPPQPLPKSNASADLLAMLLVVKFIDGLPLARFEYVLARHGVTVPRQTLARWVIGAAGVLQPLLNLMRDALLEGPFLHIDETVVQVLKEPGKAPTSNSYMWVQTGGPPERPVVVFDYDASRGGQVPVRLLHDYRGYVMTDGYSGYNELVRTDGIEQLICWAHVRRRFVEAVKVQPKGKRGLADEAVGLIGKLYGIERGHKDADDAARLLARQQHSVPVLAALRAWLDKTLPGVTPKSALGTALSYLRDYWPRLTRYTERGDLPIDNNRAENAIRPFVVGRKAWLFSDTVAGANASAVIYSVLETAKANGVEPYTWLRRVLRDLPAAKTVDQVEALLPWNLSAISDIQNGAPTGVLQ